MSFNNQDFTNHVLEHRTKNINEPNCEFCQNEPNLTDSIEELNKKAEHIINQSKDNIFNANHRNKMLRTSNYTYAEWITLEDLM